MRTFGRSFDIAALAEWDSQHPASAVRALFEHCALPGHETTSAQPLRVGARNGYLNFYAKGQSVAKLSLAREGPKLSVHSAYVSGRERNDLSGNPPEARTYVTFGPEALVGSSTVAQIGSWIATALTYTSAEKRFVDDLVAANPGIIDLEMGLPAIDAPGSPRVAPRMDIAIVQTDSRRCSIAFWEAKCANNSELRSGSDYAESSDGSFTGPKVINQVRKYIGWMAHDGHIEDVATAYRATGELLLQFYQLFWSPSHASAPDCVGIWQALVETEKPMVIVDPGLVIGNYWPEGYTEEVASGRMAQAARSFSTNGHRQKLEKHNINVFEVTDIGTRLPQLPLVSA